MWLLNPIFIFNIVFNCFKLALKEQVVKPFTRSYWNRIETKPIQPRNSPNSYYWCNTSGLAAVDTIFNVFSTEYWEQKTTMARQPQPSNSRRCGSRPLKKNLPNNFPHFLDCNLCQQKKIFSLFKNNRMFVCLSVPQDLDNHWTDGFSLNV